MPKTQQLHYCHHCHQRPPQERSVTFPRLMTVERGCDPTWDGFSHKEIIHTPTIPSQLSLFPPHQASPDPVSSHSHRSGQKVRNAHTITPGKRDDFLFCNLAFWLTKAPNTARYFKPVTLSPWARQNIPVLAISMANWKPLSDPSNSNPMHTAAPGQDGSRARHRSGSLESWWELRCI